MSQKLDHGWVGVQVPTQLRNDVSIYTPKQSFRYVTFAVIDQHSSHFETMARASAQNVRHRLLCQL